jgi:DNA-binding transcriptional regulator YdaS (Cro superfamily)
MLNSQLFPDLEVDPNLISKSEFAEAIGVHKTRVSQLIKLGLPVEPDGRVHLERGRAWVDSHVAKRAPRVDAEQRARLESKRQIEAHKAKLLELDVEQRTGALVNKRLAEDAFFRWVRGERDAWMSWVARIAPTMAGELGIDQALTFQTLDHLVRAHLEDLARAPMEPLTHA